MTLDEYAAIWQQQKARLAGIESAEGLGHALSALQQHQLELGFIQDKLNHVERHTYYHPDDPEKFFLIQFNPKRATRFNGAGRQVPPLQSDLVNEGCFLCKDNIWWQQEGKQVGYEIKAEGQTYYAWMNPFPLFPLHVVIATKEHIPQDCGFRDAKQAQIYCVLHDFLSIADRLPEDVGYYNGIDAGASIPGHRHYQFFRRQVEVPVFPLEMAAKKLKFENHNPVFVNDYPVAAAIWKGPAQELVKNASEWIYKWSQANKHRLDQLTGNYIVSKEGDELIFYFVPRKRVGEKVEPFTSALGGLEILGEIVLSTESEKAQLEDGKIDYIQIKKLLHSVYTPFSLETN